MKIDLTPAQVDALRELVAWAAQMEAFDLDALRELIAWAAQMEAFDPPQQQQHLGGDLYRKGYLYQRIENKLAEVAKADPYSLWTDNGKR